LCNQESARLNAQGNNLRYLWSTGSTNPEIIVNSANSYRVTVTNNTTNCENRDTVLVSLINIVKPNLGSDTRFCANNSSTLSITPQVNTRTLWSTGVSTNSISVNTSGTYWVEISQANCKERDSINIVVLPRPTITSTSTITICEQGTSEVTLTGTFDNVLWSNGQTQPKLPVNQPGRYTYRVSRDICTLDSAVNVTIVNIPVPDLGENLELCQGERATLTAPDFNGTTTWSTGSNAKSINVRNGGTYTLSLSSNGCTKIDSVSINLINCDGDIVYFPNIIAPNKISIDNQFFKGVLDQNYNLTNFELQVYDRQGNMVFNTTDINITWDGSLNGATLQEGVFTYKCKVSAEGRKKVEDKIISGAVTVVR
jgi:gliding motility-associated-like protein